MHLRILLSLLLLPLAALSAPTQIIKELGLTVPLAKEYGGTGGSLTDPNADRIWFWDDSANAMAFLTVGSGLAITGTTLTANAPSGSFLSSGYTMATARMLGRTTASTGAPEEIAIGANLSLSSGALNLASVITWTANTRQTFAPGATNAGLNVGSVAGDPSSPSNGDIWYDSTANELTARINGANVALGAGGGGGTSPGGSDTQVQYNDGGAFGGDSGMTFDGSTDTLTLAGNLRAEDIDLEDSDNSHRLTITTSSNLSANRTLTLVPGDSSRTLTLSSNVTLDGSEVKGPGASTDFALAMFNGTGGVSLKQATTSGCALFGDAGGNLFMQGPSATNTPAIHLLVGGFSKFVQTYYNHSDNSVYTQIVGDSSTKLVLRNYDASKFLQLNGDGSIRINGYGAGTLTTDSSGNISATSDITLKLPRGAFTRGLEAIRRLSPIIYSWRPESGMETLGQYAGFSAQDVRAAIPEAVGQQPDGKLTLQDRVLIATLTNAVKELDSQNGALLIAIALTFGISCVALFRRR